MEQGLREKPRNQKVEASTCSGAPRVRERERVGLERVFCRVLKQRPCGRNRTIRDKTHEPQLVAQGPQRDLPASLGHAINPRKAKAVKPMSSQVIRRLPEPRLQKE